MKIDIEKRKIEILAELDELDKEMMVLLDRIREYRADLLKVETEEDAAKFNETHNLEEGFRHIQIW